MLLLALIVLLVPVAWWLRFHAPIDNRWRDWSGGAAYVVFWSAVVVLIRPPLAAGPVALGVLAVTCMLEFLQLWHPVWLELLRSTLPGRLILGTTFDWGDFPAYFVGALVSFLLLQGLIRISQDRNDRLDHLSGVDVHHPKS